MLSEAATRYCQRLVQRGRSLESIMDTLLSIALEGYILMSSFEFLSGSSFVVVKRSWLELQLIAPPYCVHAGVH